MLPSDDEGKNERHKKRLKEQLDKLKRNQERRLARKNQKLGIPTGAMGVGGKRAVKTETVSTALSCSMGRFADGSASLRLESAPTADSAVT